ncbi:MAG TPA: peptidoglycan-associated lipoprotein Pal [Acidobacteriota bacterium]|jgi:peptidoglycan-associated lipoprotein|nr:peptidoglycan-associated lipoprotein Pal [Acidobacteriota bacterium]
MLKARAGGFHVLLLVVLVMLMFACKRKPAQVSAPSPGGSRPTAAATVSGPTREPTVQISAEPSTLRSGESFTLSWGSTDAEHFTIDNGVGSVPASGSLKLAVLQSTTYTATASNRLGSASASTRVTVTEGEPTAVTPPSDEIRNIEDIMRRGLIKDVFFDYDQYDLRHDAQEILKQDAEYLRRFPNVSFILEGHCDDRGTAEYNLALGDRRAQSVKSYLVSLGISASRLETISYGEERPFALGHDESSWAQNRRAHFTLRR